MKPSIIINTACFICLSSAGLQSYAQTTTPVNSATAESAVQATFPAGTFDGDGIQIKLENTGKFVITGGAVDKPLHGTWVVEKKGNHTLLRLTPNNKKEDEWLFGVRSKDTIQMVDEDKLKILDRPIDVNEDVGVLSREK